jgi:hypothetical protein
MVSRQLHTPSGSPVTYWASSYISPTAGLDVSEKRNTPCACQESNPGPASPLTEFNRLPLGTTQPGQRRRNSN